MDLWEVGKERINSIHDGKIPNEAGKHLDIGGIHFFVDCLANSNFIVALGHREEINIIGNIVVSPWIFLNDNCVNDNLKLEIKDRLFELFVDYDVDIRLGDIWLWPVYLQTTD